jgi:hypothetical protein
VRARTPGRDGVAAPSGRAHPSKLAPDENGSNPGDGQPVVASVLQDVDEGVPDFTRREECPRVVAVGEQRADAAPEPVEAARDADQQTLNASRERAAIARLDDQVEVVRLDGEVDQPEPEAVRAGGECALEGASCGVVAQVRQTGSHARGDVHRMSCG